MTYHEWGDKDFDWDSLQKATHELWRYCKKWGRVGLHVKEKYGTLRAYTTCAFVGRDHALHSLLWPGYAFIQWKYHWMSWFDRKVFTPVWWALFGGLFFKYQKYIYIRGYKRVVNLYPHIKDEILVMADHLEWIDKELKDKYWMPIDVDKK